MSRSILALGAAALLAVSGCAGYDRAAGTNTSGAYPRQSDGRPGNPPGTELSRTYDRTMGTDTSGAYPSQRNGTPENPQGSAISRTYDRTMGTDTSGAYPQNRNQRY
ncbi:MAG: hypothetical protein RQ966_16140 [Acetobacteraceae bacterium]|nr:hypothetical protein [Acetobacteraceae bacterium]